MQQKHRLGDKHEKGFVNTLTKSIYICNLLDNIIEEHNNTTTTKHIGQYKLKTHNLVLSWTPEKNNTETNSLDNITEEHKCSHNVTIWSTVPNMRCPHQTNTNMVPVLHRPIESNASCLSIIENNASNN